MLSDVSLVGGWLPVTVDVIAVVLTLALAYRLIRSQGTPGLSARSRFRQAAVALVLLFAIAAAGVVVGLLVCWLVSDYWNLLDVSLSPASRAWVAGSFAVLAIAVSATVRRGRERRGSRWILAATTGVAALLAGAFGVNADFGQYTTFGSLTDQSVAAPLPVRVAAEQRAGAPDGTKPQEHEHAAALWSAPAPAGMPARGLISTVTIPATISHFAARAAYLYLPPAALVAHPAALPVLVMLSGQPGSPSNLVSSGRIGQILDSFADAHHGLAPIVVIPDQLGAPDRNPMCVDGSLGASASYLTIDVPNWIRANLTVQTSPSAWAIGGFSQGGTCSIQFGSEHPELFSSILDISGQRAPKNGDLANTIDVGFAGDSVAYRAAEPSAILARNAPYSDTVAVFGVGQLDTRYGPIAREMAVAARAAGISATERESPGSAHDWRTVRWVLEHAMMPIYRHLGLAKPL